MIDRQLKVMQKSRLYVVVKFPVYDTSLHFPAIYDKKCSQIFSTVKIRASCRQQNFVNNVTCMIFPNGPCSEELLSMERGDDPSVGFPNDQLVDWLVVWFTAYQLLKDT